MTAGDTNIYRVSIYEVSSEEAKDFKEGRIDKSDLMDLAYDNWKDGFYEKSFDEAGMKAVEVCKEKGFEILMRIFLDVETNTIIKRVY